MNKNQIAMKKQRIIKKFTMMMTSNTNRESEDQQNLNTEIVSASTKHSAHCIAILTSNQNKFPFVLKIEKMAFNKPT